MKFRAISCNIPTKVEEEKREEGVSYTVFSSFERRKVREG